MMRTRRIAVAAATGTLGLGLAAPLAAMADTTPPPSGTASGTGLSVGAGGQPVATVSPTQASAGQQGSSASAGTVQVGGQNVGPAGSSQNGAAPAQGSLASTPSGSPVDASVADYSASSGSGSARSTSTLAHADAGSGSGVSADVLRSSAAATYSSSRSTGDSSTDGAVVDAGGLNVDVLHSESHSLFGAGSYLVGVNGTDIGTSQDAGKICSSLSNSSLPLYLACVTATGGDGSFLASVANAALPADSSGLDIVALSASGAGNPGAGPAVLTTGGAGPAASTTGTTATTVGLPVVPAGPATAVSPVTASSGGGLPFTGAPIEFWVLVSGALLALGGVVWRLSTVVRPTLVV